MESEGRTMGKVDRQQGWIFIDVMIGIVILSVALVGILGAYNTIPKEIVYAEDYRIALAIAREETNYWRLKKGKITTEEVSLRNSDGVPLRCSEYPLVKNTKDAKKKIEEIKENYKVNIDLGENIIGEKIQKLTVTISLNTVYKNANPIILTSYHYYGD